MTTNANPNSEALKGLDASHIKRMQEWIIWYNWHHSMLHNADVEKRVAFLDKCVQGLFELIVNTNAELARLDQRRNRPNIILPTGITFNEPIRQ